MKDRKRSEYAKGAAGNQKAFIKEKTFEIELAWRNKPDKKAEHRSDDSNTSGKDHAGVAQRYLERSRLVFALIAQNDACCKHQDVHHKI